MGWHSARAQPLPQGGWAGADGKLALTCSMWDTTRQAGHTCVVNPRHRARGSAEHPATLVYAPALWPLGVGAWVWGVHCRVQQCACLSPGPACGTRRQCLADREGKDWRRPGATHRGQVVGPCSQQ